MSKSLIFTDIHFGINSDKPSRQKIAANVVDELVQVCEINGISRIFFLGDLFHHRTSIEVSTLNLADAAVTKLSSVAELTLIQGNHDLYERSGLSQSSTAIFAKHKAKIIARPTELTLNNQSVILIPWCGDERGITIHKFFDACGFKPTQDKYDIIMGHINITDGKPAFQIDFTERVYHHFLWLSRWFSVLPSTGLRYLQPYGKIPVTVTIRHPWGNKARIAGR